MKKNTAIRITLDRVAGAVIAILLLASVLVVIAGRFAGVRVRGEFGATVGPFGPLVFRFSVPVNPDLFQACLEIHPNVLGEIEWSDDRTARFVPAQPLQPDTLYVVRCAAGKLGKLGETLSSEEAWRFAVRKPLIVFMAFADRKNQLMLVDAQGGEPRPLFDNEQFIFDFDVSRDGEIIIFSNLDEDSGLDLWQVGRDGLEPRLLLDCGTGRCSTPAISPDGRWLAYTREGAGISPDSPPGAPRIWILDLAGGDDRPLFADSQVLGYGALWSPDGKWVASYDGLQDAIRVVSVDSAEQIVLESALGTNMSWSADSSRLLYTDVETTPDGTRTVVRIADFRSGEIADLLGATDGYDYGYGALAWSPVEDKFVLGLQPLPDDIGQSLWLVDPDVLAGPMIASQANMSYDVPRWDVWGQAIMFQRFQLNKAYKPEIAVWRPGYDEPLIVAEGLSARWMP